MLAGIDLDASEKVRTRRRSPTPPVGNPRADNYARSNRSAFITLLHAATKAVTKAPAASSVA